MSNIKTECFMKAAEVLNFTEAANQLFITQPAFSRNILSLEKEMGIQLFIRNGKAKAIRLTAAGAVYYKGLLDLKKQHETLITEVNRVARAEEGKIYVGVLSGCLMDQYAMEYLDEFRQKYPKIEVILRSCSFHELVEYLQSGQIDLSIVLDKEVKDLPDIISDVLYSVESYLVVPKNRGIEEKKIHSIKEFEEETFIVSKDTPKLTELLRWTCSQKDFEPHILEAPNFETQMLWVENGMGVAGNSQQHMLGASKNVQFLHIEEFMEMDYVAAWHKKNYNPVIAKFASMHDIIN